MNGLTTMMSMRRSAWILFTAAAALPLGTAAAQVVPRAPAPRPATTVPAPRPVATVPAARVPAARTQPGASVPGVPGLVPAQPESMPVELPPSPPPIWDVMSAQDLVYYIRQIGREGLNPADYDAEGLEAAIASGDPLRMSAEATERFKRLSWDLAMGHVVKAARSQWFIVDKDLDAARQDALLRSALVAHSIRASLDGLLPTHPQYAALKNSLEMTPATETSRLNKIRLNMDRWRWLPRDLGQKYIIVNVPGFHATLVENGVNRWKHRAIAGATKTPTPQLSAMAVGVMLNPSWEVPPSITHEVVGKKGFVPIMKNGKLIRWSQPPGPTNALGQIKFVMYNPQNIYLHDTNARSRFSSRMRALSHGCIRTEHIMDLATELLGDDDGPWTPERIQAQLATGKTKQANFVKPVPVYIVYFSQAALLDGTIVDYQDMYHRDGTALAALQMKDGGVSLAKKAAPKTPEKVASR
ncbi:MAG: L,D-transpeptidase family protein [Sphingomicrobium sp.]